VRQRHKRHPLSMLGGLQKLADYTIARKSWGEAGLCAHGAAQRDPTHVRSSTSSKKHRPTKHSVRVVPDTRMVFPADAIMFWTHTIVPRRASMFSLHTSSRRARG
jgi:hypothetical protein